MADYTNLIGRIFCFKKFYKILVLAFSRCLHRLTRFTSGLYVCIVRFPHVLALLLVSLVCITFIIGAGLLNGGFFSFFEQAIVN